MQLRSGSPCLIIGEVAQAHDGSLGLAHAFVDAIANAGAHAVKFQTHLAAAESTTAEPWRVRFSRQDESRFGYWKRMEFTEEQWHGLKQHADERGLLFLSSPFSLEAVSLLERVGVAAWKVASGEASNPLLVARLAKTRLPVLLSTGMSSFSEIDSAVAKIKSFGAPLAVLQCTSSYPCGPEKIGLNVIRQFRERYQTCVGLSDHSGTIFPGLAAAVLGIEVLEVHVTLSREMFGPDVASSLTTAELGQLVEGVRFIETMRASNVDKDAEARELTPLRNMFTRSVTVRCDLPAGNILREDQLTLKKPGTGIRPERLKELVGRKLRRAITAETLLSEDDID